jgi:uncharacterized membrane protein
MNPFDLKAVLLEKHAQHVAIIHFPIALLLVSFLLDLLALWRKSPAMAAAARYNLFCAAISALFAVGTGLAAWQWLLNGVELTGTLRLHLSFALASFVMLIGLSLWRRTFPNHGQLMGWRYLLLAFMACVLISLTGHMGGFVSGLNLTGH